MHSPLRGTCDLCFECKMIVSKAKNKLNANTNLPDEADDAADDDNDDNVQLKDKLIQSANYAKIVRAQ